MTTRILIKDGNSKSEYDFPLLMQSRSDDEVVLLFITEEKATILSRSKSYPFILGTTSDFRISEFKEFKGVLQLYN